MLIHERWEEQCLHMRDGRSSAYTGRMRGAVLTHEGWEEQCLHRKDERSSAYT